MIVEEIKEKTIDDSIVLDKNLKRYSFKYKVSKEIQEKYAITENQVFRFNSNDVKILSNKLEKIRKAHYENPYSLYSSYSKFEFNIIYFYEYDIEMCDLNIDFRNIYHCPTDEFLMCYNEINVDMMLSKLELINNKYFSHINSLMSCEITSTTIEHFENEIFEDYIVESTEYIHKFKPIENIEQLFIVYLYTETLYFGVTGFVRKEQRKIEKTKKEINDRLEKEQCKKDVKEAIDFYKKMKDKYPELMDE